MAEDFLTQRNKNKIPGPSFAEQASSQAKSISNSIGNKVSGLGDEAKSQISNARQALGLESPPIRKAPIRESSQAPARNTNYMVLISQLVDGADTRTVSAFLPESFNFDLQSDYSTPFGDSMSSSGVINAATKLLGVSTITQQMTAQFWAGSSHLSFNLPLVFVSTSSREEISKPIGDLMAMCLPSKAAGFEETGFLVAPGPRYKLNTDVDLVKAATNLIDSAYATLAAEAKHLSDVFTGTTKNEKGETVAIDRGQPMISALNEPAKQLTKYIKDNVKLHNQISITIGNFMRFDNVVVKNVQQTYASRFDADGYPMKVEVSVTVETQVTPTVEDMLLAMNITRDPAPKDLEMSASTSTGSAAKDAEIERLEAQNAAEFEKDAKAWKAAGNEGSYSESPDQVARDKEMLRQIEEIQSN